MEKGKLGIRFSFYAVVAFILAFLGYSTLLFLLAGVVLIAEKNEWAFRQIVQAFCLCVVSSIFSYILGILDFMYNIPFIGSVWDVLTSISTAIVSIIVLVFCILGILNTSKGKEANIPLASKFANWAYGIVIEKAPQYQQAPPFQQSPQYQQPQPFQQSPQYQQPQPFQQSPQYQQSQPFQQAPQQSVQPQQQFQQAPQQDVQPQQQFQQTPQQDIQPQQQFQQTPQQDVQPQQQFQQAPQQNVQPQPAIQLQQLQKEPQDTQPDSNIPPSSNGAQ